MNTHARAGIQVTEHTYQNAPQALIAFMVLCYTMASTNVHGSAMTYTGRTS